MKLKILTERTNEKMEAAFEDFISEQGLIKIEHVKVVEDSTSFYTINVYIFYTKIGA